MRDSERRAAADVARVLVAAQLHRGSTSESIAWWAAWLDQVTQAGFELSSLDVDVRLRAAALSLGVWSAHRPIVDAVDRMLGSHQVDESERERMFGVFTLAGRRDVELGVWATQLGDGYEGGWGLRGELDTSFLTAVIGDAAFSPIEPICDAFSLESVGRISRAVARGAASWDVELPLGTTALESVWDDTMMRLNLPATSPALRRWLEQPASDAALQLRLVATGLASVGITVPVTSPTELAGALAAVGIPESDDEQVAALAGALGGSPRAAQLVRDARGLDLVIQL